MKKNIIFLLVPVFILTITIQCQPEKDMGDNSTVDNIDLERYLGTWYEIARFPNSFEKGLTGVTATYSKRDDGKIKVLNQGYKDSLDGKLKKIVGKAKVPDKDQAGKLKVSFFLWFYAEYNILALDTGHYQWALVGSGPDYLWVLCRNPKMDEDLYQSLVEVARERGYDVSRLKKVEQPVD